MNNLILSVCLIIAYYLVAIGNLFFGLINNLNQINDNSSQPQKSQPPTLKTLIIFSSIIFSVWFVLSYINSSYVGFYSLLILYIANIFVAVDSLNENAKFTRINPNLFLCLSIYIELLFRFHNSWNNNIFINLGILFLVFVLSILTAIFWLIFSSLVVFGIAAIKSRQSDNPENVIGFICKISIYWFVMIIGLIPIGISVLQSSLLGVDFNLVLWINLNFILEVALIYIIKKTGKLFIDKTHNHLYKYIVVGLPIGGLICGYLAQPQKLYVYDNRIILCIGISLVIMILFYITNINFSKKNPIQLQNQEIYSFYYKFPEIENYISKIEISENGKLLAIKPTQFKDIETIKIINTDTKKIVREIKFIENIWDDKFIFSRDSKEIVNLDTKTNVISYWDIYTGEKNKEISLNCDNEKVSSFDFNQDTLVLAFTKESDSQNGIELWTFENGKTTHFLEGGNFPLAFSPDGTMVASGSNNYGYTNEIWIWRNSQKTVLKSDMHINGWICILTFSPNNQILACTIDNIILLWNVTTQELLHQLQLPSEPINTESIAFSPDSKYLASVSGSARNNTVMLWDINSGQICQVLKDGSLSENYDLASSLVFSPDAEKLYIGTNNGIQCWRKNRIKSVNLSNK